MSLEAKKEKAIAMWDVTVEGVLEGDWLRTENDMGEHLFLPAFVQGKSVLIEEPNSDNRVWKTYLVDNRELRDKTQGLGFRYAKNLESKDDTVAEWSTYVQGLDEGDGWLQTL